jgi:hypothetical protein
MITYNWTVSQLERRVSDGFVQVCHYRCDAVDGDFSIVVGTYGTCGWGDGAPTVDYEDLTPETVLAWVWESVDKDATEASLADQINALKNPSSASGLPWAAA